MIGHVVFACAAFAAVLALGRYARHAAVGVDAKLALAAFGKATRVAWFFTKLGYARDLLFVYAIAGVALVLTHPRDLPALAFLAVAQVGSQLVSTALKDVFKRERPERWLKRHELSAGYPSGHATTATVTYAGIAFVLLVPVDASIAVPVRDGIAFLGLGLAAGIIWSRLALGAHFLSDVIGGMLLGSATLSLVAIVIHRG